MAKNYAPSLKTRNPRRKVSFTTTTRQITQQLYVDNNLLLTKTAAKELQKAL